MFFWSKKKVELLPPDKPNELTVNRAVKVKTVVITYFDEMGNLLKCSPQVFDPPICLVSGDKLRLYPEVSI